MQNLEDYIYSVSDYVVKDMKIVKYKNNLVLKSGGTLNELVLQNKELTLDDLTNLRSIPNVSLLIIDEENVEQVGFSSDKRKLILEHLYKYLQNKDTPDGFKQYMYKIIIEMAVNEGLN